MSTNPTFDWREASKLAQQHPVLEALRRAVAATSAALEIAEAALAAAEIECAVAQRAHFEEHFHRTSLSIGNARAYDEASGSAYLAADERVSVACAVRDAARATFNQAERAYDNTARIPPGSAA